MNGRNGYLFKNTALFAIGTLGTKIITFLLVPLYTFFLSTSEYGLIDLITTIGTVLIPILTFNIGESVMRFSLDKNADYDKVMTVGYVFIAVSIVLGILIIPLVHIFPMISGYSIEISLYCITSGICQILVCSLKGQEKILQYSISNFLTIISVAILNVYFLFILKEGIEGYFNAYIVAYIITIVYAALTGRKKTGKSKISFDSKIARSMITYSVVLIPNSFMWWIMNASDRLMITAMIGESANGVYAISYKIPTMLSVLTGIFNQAWSYSAIKENESVDNEEYSNKIYDRLVKLLFLCIAFLLLVMKPFLRIYVPNTYYESWKYIPHLLIGFGFMSLGTFLSASYTANKDSKGFLFSGLLGACINLILNAILIPLIGPYGAALATCVSYTAVYIFRVVNTRKYVHIHVLKREHIFGFIIIIMMALTTYIENGLGKLALVLEFVVMLVFLHKIIYKLILCIWSRQFD